MDIIAKIPQNDKMTTFPPTVWYGCYDEGWKDISPESFSHPAKFAQGLVRKIFEYGLEMGYIKVGDVILDTFGGVGLGAKYALANGLNWIGCELEPRFTDLGQGCNCTGISKADWIRFYGRWDKMAHKDGRHWCPQCLAEAKQVTDSQQLSFFEPEPTAAYARNSGIIPSTQPHYYRGNLDLFRKYAKPGTWAILLNGDSRNLRAVIGQAQGDGLLSSPPYASLDTKGGRNGGTQVGGRHKKSPTQEENSAAGSGLGYGDTTGQLGAMKPGSLADSLLSSPPYINSVNQSTQANDTEARIERMRQAGIDVTNRANVGGGNGVARQPQNYGSTDGQLGAMKEGELSGLVSSPPFLYTKGGANSPNLTRDLPGLMNRQAATAGGGYGHTEGQLSDLTEGDLADSLVSSPPFAGNTGGRGEASRNGIDAALFDRHSGGMKRGTGDDPGNLDHLPMRGLQDALVSSPPFEDGVATGDPNFLTPGERGKRIPSKSNFATYGQTTGQLGIEQGQTFWAAAREIVSESYLALKPGAYTFWVCKSFIREGKMIDFPNQWKQLCEAVGFEYIESIHAMLVSQEQKQENLDGGSKTIRKERKSFFRRLAERNGSPRIDYEVVVILRKPYNVV